MSKDIDRFIQELNDEFNLGLTKEEIIKAKKKALEDIEDDQSEHKDKKPNKVTRKTSSDK